MTIKEKELCVECYQPLIEPVCFDCLKKEMLSWLRDESFVWRVHRKIIDIFDSVFNSYNLDNRVICVICNEKKPAICKCCFVRNAFFKIKEMLNRKSLENFSLIFL